MNKLTPKQEAFAKEYVLNGGNASAAYRHAYDAENMKPEVINVKASELLSNGKVSVRVEELQSKTRKAAEKKFEWSAEQRLKMLYDVAVTCSTLQQEKDDDGNLIGEGRMQNPTAVISAIDQANKMTGDHAAIKQKTDVTTNGESINRIERVIVDVNTSNSNA